MDYEEKKYKDLLKRARQLRDENCDGCKMCLENLFHELVESEDEKMKNWILDELRLSYQWAVGDSDRCEELLKAITWLEKQGEQKNKISFTLKDVLALECSMKTAKITKGGESLYEILVPLYNKIHNAYLLEIQDKKKPLNDTESIAKAVSDFKVGVLPIEEKSPVESLGISPEKYEEISNECIYGEEKYVDVVEPKFHEGDVMRTIQEAADGVNEGLPVIVSIDNEYYHCTNELIIIKDQDDYEYPPMNRKQKSQLYADKVEPKSNVVMTQEEKELLLKDLCARLPYGVIIQYRGHNTIIKNKLLTGSDLDCNMEYYKPYLRPMSTMTEEEKEELCQEQIKDEQLYVDCIKNHPEMRGLIIPHFAEDWCNKNMFDYRGLIPKGLAIAVTKENNPYEN